MAGNPKYSESDPRHHISNIKRMLDEVSRHVRQDVQKITEPRAQALFETTAEVLGGLSTAYEHYESKSEPALRS